MSNEMLLNLTADIVAAQVSNNKVAADQLPSMVQSVYATLETLGQPKDPVREPREPAVSIRSSVKQDFLVCLECGFKAKMLKRHLLKAHGYTPEQYRQAWKLPVDYPIVAPGYARLRKDLAVEIGLGRSSARRKSAEHATAAQAEAAAEVDLGAAPVEQVEATDPFE